MTRGLGMEWGNNYLRMKIWWHPVVSANNHPALGYPYYSVLASRQKTGTLAVWSKKKDCVDLWRDPGQSVRGDSRAHQGQWGAGLRAFTSLWAAICCFHLLSLWNSGHNPQDLVFECVRQRRTLQWFCWQRTHLKAHCFWGSFGFWILCSSEKSIWFPLAFLDESKILWHPIVSTSLVRVH